MKYWGYKHTSGTIHIKKAIGVHLDDVLDDARSSSFVDILIEPFEATDIADAGSKLRQMIAEREKDR